MQEQKSLVETKKAIREFFEAMGVDVEIQRLFQEEKTIFVKLNTPDPKILIGQNGQILSEIQHLLKIILRRKNLGQFFIDLDINNYKEKKFSYLRETANSVADEVALTKKEKELAPMPAYERRVIHLELADRKDVTTESIGEEPKRRVVIRPYP